MKINAEGLYYKELNEQVKATQDTEIILENVQGHRYIGCGLAKKHIEVHGVPGNALGAYLDGASITVYANGQDATGDTMNNGKIVIHGNCGDTTGYAMRNGQIYVKGYAGYRVGIHMKEYMELRPVIVIGERVGDFLGEYQAGGLIIVLGIGFEGTGKIPVGNFCGTGMHGGAIYIRSDEIPDDLPPQVVVSDASAEDLEEIRAYVEEFCRNFGGDANALLQSHFYKLKPNTKNPYRQLYTHN